MVVSPTLHKADDSGDHSVTLAPEEVLSSSDSSSVAKILYR